MTLNEQHKHILLQVAKASIVHGFDTGMPLRGLVSEDPLLSTPGAAFVTLNRYGQLRGCIGSLQAYRPLIEDVADNAFKAAFSDPRFPPLSRAETAGLSVEVSVLTPPTPIEECDSPHALLRQLTPFEDGLIIDDGVHRATFLPSVWEQLPNPEDFLRQLMAKAGMTAWSPSMRCWRYHTVKFAAPWEAIAPLATELVQKVG